ncbi:MAG: hypothetical protein ACPG40_08550 [Alphaproteobacteria bacterium]
MAFRFGGRRTIFTRLGGACRARLRLSRQSRNATPSPGSFLR